MNTPLLALPVSAPTPDVVKKKRVLLVDTSHAKRDLRAEVLRKLGMDVDSAADIVEARSWWKPGLYDLVLVNIEKGRGQRDKFCDDLRSATPSQRLAFLPPLAMQKAQFESIRGIRLSGGASSKLRVESPQPAPRRSHGVKRCAPCLPRHEILKDG